MLSSRGGVLAGMPRCVPPRTHLGIRRNNRTHTLQNSIQNLTRHSYQYPGVQYPGVYEEHSWVGSGTHVWALNEERAGALGARWTVSHTLSLTHTLPPARVHAVYVAGTAYLAG
jgi:hypothetical protein